MNPKTEAEIYKIETFHKFICLKNAFQTIHHKKIVHFILQRYSNIKNYINLNTIKLPKTPQDYYNALSQKLYNIPFLQFVNLNLSFYETENHQKFEQLSKIFKIFPQIKTLDLVIYNDMILTNLPKFIYSCSQLQNPRGFEKLSLSLGIFKQLDTTFIKLLFLAIEKHENLRYLKLDFNFFVNIFTQENCSILANTLQRLNKLLYLSLCYRCTWENNNINQYLIFKQLKQLKHLELDLQGNYLGSKNNEAFLKMMEDITQLQQLNTLILNLTFNELEKNIFNQQTLVNTLKSFKFLTTCKLDLSANNLGKNPENMQILSQGIKYLSENPLQHFSLNLTLTQLWENQSNFDNLVDGLKYLNKVKILELFLNRNETKKKPTILAALMQTFQNLHSLTHITLSLYDNYSIKHFGNTEKDLKQFKQLQYFKLTINSRDFFENCQIMRSIFFQLTDLQELKLDLIQGIRNDLKIFSFKPIYECISVLVNLHTLKLHLSQIDLGNNSNNNKHLFSIFPKLPKLQYLTLNLYRVSFSNRIDQLSELSKGIRQLSNLQMLCLELYKMEIKQENIDYVPVLLTALQSLRHSTCLRKLILNLSYIPLTGYMEKVRQLFKIIKGIPSLLYIKLYIYETGLYEFSHELNNLLNDNNENDKIIKLFI